MFSPHLRSVAWGSLHLAPAFGKCLQPVFSVQHALSVQVVLFLFMSSDLHRFCPQIHSPPHLASSVGGESNQEARAFHLLPSSQPPTPTPSPQSDREALSLVSVRGTSPRSCPLCSCFSPQLATKKLLSRKTPRRT